MQERGNCINQFRRGIKEDFKLDLKLEQTAILNTSLTPTEGESSISSIIVFVVKLNTNPFRGTEK